jgi:hypothetical protein
MGIRICPIASHAERLGLASCLLLHMYDAASLGVHHAIMSILVFEQDGCLVTEVIYPRLW